MNAKFSLFALPIAAASLAFSLYALNKRQPAPAKSEATPPTAAAPSALPGASDGELEARLAKIERLLAESAATTSPAAPDAALDQRLSAIESSLAQLQNSFDGISLESASEERDALFRSEDGHLTADEYFAAGKYAIAGEGYLAFLEAHPDHPDAYNILGRARDSFRRAGYTDKAIWAQEELIKNLGERRDGDVLALAQLEKDAGRLDDAITHAAEAAELATEPSQALWHRMYWAWYNQLRDGDQAGLNAYRQVQQQIADAGYAEERIGQRVAEKIEEIERRQP